MFYRITKWLLGPLVRAYFRISVEGVDHVPGDGPVILAANHCSFFDSWFVPLVIPRRVTYVAKAEYFDQWYTAWLFRAWGQIPIRRGGGSASERALESAIGVLAQEGVFGIYPEGTRSPDGRLYKGRTGVARVALRSGAPVVPAGIIGSFEAAPKHRKIPRPGRVIIRFGEPLDLRAHAGREDQRLALRAATDEVMFEISQLTGQAYVDRYSGEEAGAIDPAVAIPVGAVA
jgi:1-acyl-sn-glycerol-3-phosphate acyltransferase